MKYLMKHLKHLRVIYASLNIANIKRAHRSIKTFLTCSDPLSATT